MNASYKIALVAAVGLLVLVVGYYAVRGSDGDNLTQAAPELPLDPASADHAGDPTPGEDARGDRPAAGRNTPPTRPGPGDARPGNTPASHPTTTPGGTPGRAADATTPGRRSGPGSVVDIGPPPTDPLITLRGPSGEPLTPGNPGSAVNASTPGSATNPGSATPADPIVRASPETTVTTDTETTPGRGATPDTRTPEAPERVTPERTTIPADTTPPPTRTEAPARRGVPATYTVQPGDMLVHIAERFYGSQAAWEDIAQANPTVDPTRLRVGQEIRLPAPAAAERPRTEPPATRPGTRERYTVKPGDNLTRIAERFYGDANKWDVIYNHNRDAIGPDPGRLRAGMTLDIPPAVAGAE